MLHSCSYEHLTTALLLNVSRTTTARMGQCVLLENHQERDSDTHDRHGVEQTSDNEHTGLKHRGQFRLASNALQETTTHQTEAQTSANACETSDDSSCKQVHVFHFLTPVC